MCSVATHGGLWAGVALHTLPVRTEEDRPSRPLVDVEIERAPGPRRQRDRDVLASLAHDRHRPVAAVDTHRFDVGAERFADPKPVEGEKRDQRVVAGRTQPGLDKQTAQFVAIEAEGA